MGGSGALVVFVDLMSSGWTCTSVLCRLAAGFSDSSDFDLVSVAEIVGGLSSS